MNKATRSTKFLKRISGIVIALAALFFTSGLLAQTVTGTITGVITDPSGAVVGGASVVAHNTDTNVDSRVTTNASGLYRIQFLPIGRYEVTVEAKGFDKETIPAFQLEVLQITTFNVTLTVGSSAEVVNVSEAAPILNTSDATLSGTFTANTIQNFPLNGLDFSALTLYVPGSVSTVGTSGTTSIERSTQSTDSINLNGNRAQANNYTLDGIDLNETFNNLIAYSPAPEALQEIKVLTSNSPADYGNVNGAGVVAVLKSGTNQFHGSAYGYVQDYKLNANSWTNNHQSPIIPTNPFSQSQFGGTIGGPIKRDKLFFFADYLGSRFHQGGTHSASVFTQAMRNGDFSALLTGSNPIQLYDPLNGFAPYVGNKGVPINNPVAQYLFAHPELYPLPNATPSDGIANNDFQGPQRTFRANNQGDIKIEYTPNNADKISGFFSKSDAYDGATSVLPVSFPNGSTFPSQLGGLTWVRIFSPSIVNSARIGFTRINWNQGLPIDQTGVFGNNGNAVVGITFPNQAFQGFTFQNISGGLNGLGNSAQNNGSLTDNTYSYIDNLTWQRGKSTFSMGVQALRYQNNYPTSNNNGFLGSLNYTGAFTGNPSLANAGGYGGADFVLDRVSGAAATLASVNVGQRQWRVAGFFSDDYKATSRLTLNAGLRYEYDQPWVESNNKTGNIDIATGQVIYASKIPVGAPVGSGLCSNRACYDANYRQFTPRLGFAYQATDRFVIRGGYGATSFFEGNSSNQRLTSITPFIQAVNVNVVTPTPGNPGVPRTAQQGFTGGTVSSGGTFNVYPQNIQPAYVQEFNLTTEYAVTRSLSLQVGYVGEIGQHIEDYGNLNQWRVNGDPTSAPYYNNQFIGINAIDPSVSIGSNSLLITESRAASNYQALQTILRQRTNHGLEFTVNYSYGKALTNSAGNYAVNTSGASNFGQGAFQNYYDSAADWGPAAYDVRHNFSGTGVYSLPFGHGKQYLSGVNRAVDEAIGGWKVSTAAVVYSGFPETINGPGNNSNSFGNARPNQYRALKIVNRTIDNWYGTDPSAIPCTTPGVDNGLCAFGAPAPNTFGDARNGNTRGPRYLNVDMSAFKDFTIIREQTLGFRFDAFNAFNIASYGNPDTNIGDANFGNISNQGTANGIQQAVRSTERRLQFSANYRF
ncbi:TonB-dependent receptor [Tunturibacter psychrotolerans]|uniref:TonB-dependent receptor n=1 Tax=Tunturiibacter psychrotolerans TaxID=3069686 RepID=A0AAU7ZWS0_9BACT